MATKETYRMGTYVVGQNDRPTLNELAGALDDEFIEREVEELEESGKKLSYQDKGRNVWVEESDGGDRSEYDYCHFRYVSDTKDSYRVRTDDGEEEEQNETRLVDCRVIYFRNGQFIYESKNNVEDSWVPQFIGRATNYDIEGTDYRLYSLGEEYMGDVYDNHNIVTQLRLREPAGESQGVSDEVGEFIRDLAGDVKNFEFGADRGSNLKEKESINICANNLAIQNIHAKHEDDTMKELTGVSLSKSWDAGEATPDEMEAQVARESLAVRNAVQEELERLKRIYQ